jgi:hypothetical protein
MIKDAGPAGHHFSPAALFAGNRQFPATIGEPGRGSE